MKTLIGMTDFVLEQNREPKSQNEQSRAFYYCCNYAKFLKQPLELWMFVPCDEDGNVLEVVPYYADGIEKVNEYKKAKERCLFDGFEYSETHINGIDNNLNLFIFPYANNRFGLTKKEEGFRTWFQLFTVEDLVQCDLQLTPNTQRQF